MKHILFTLALASIAGIANAQHNGHSYTVEGLINDSTLNGQTLYISRYDDGMKVDSTQVTNGQFKFTGKADIPCFAASMQAESMPTSSSKGATSRSMY